jgi:UDP-N-acetylglucosamine--N-acetylmuramyl-(pentapeptide) pyrophosphoryl-undecaprenol N-acetylglucosamine transferase
MKILLTGGGTGGHFWPLIAVAEELNTLLEEQKVLGFKLYYMADTEYNKAALFENQIEFISVPAGKLRTYSSAQNFFDGFRTAWGSFVGLLKVFSLYPDVVFSKGGYASFPAVFAARILRIPVVIHESDTVPGRVNLWSAKFAERIAVSYPEAYALFPKDKTAQTGQPIRRDLLQKVKEGAHTYFKLDPSIPTIVVVGGSQGAQIINDTILDVLPSILPYAQVIHQTGEKLYQETVYRTQVVLDKNEFKDRYHIFKNLSTADLKYAAGTATLFISRAGSMIFEIAQWEVPSIIIPIKPSVSRDQTANAFSYARTGACVVIEESNLTASILADQIKHILDNPNLQQAMIESAKTIRRPDAARTIAQAIIDIGIKHES